MHHNQLRPQSPRQQAVQGRSQREEDDPQLLSHLDRQSVLWEQIYKGGGSRGGGGGGGGVREVERERLRGSGGAVASTGTSSSTHHDRVSVTNCQWPLQQHRGPTHSDGEPAVPPLVSGSSTLTHARGREHGSQPPGCRPQPHTGSPHMGADPMRRRAVAVDGRCATAGYTGSHSHSHSHSHSNDSDLFSSSNRHNDVAGHDTDDSSAVTRAINSNSNDDGDDSKHALEKEDLDPLSLRLPVVDDWAPASDDKLSRSPALSPRRASSRSSWREASRGPSCLKPSLSRFSHLDTGKQVGSLFSTTPSQAAFYVPASPSAFHAPASPSSCHPPASSASLAPSASQPAESRSQAAGAPSSSPSLPSHLFPAHSPNRCPSIQPPGGGGGGAPRDGWLGCSVAASAAAGDAARLIWAPARAGPKLPPAHAARRWPGGTSPEAKSPQQASAQ